MSSDLAKDMSENERFNIPYEGEALDIVYASIKKEFHDEINEYLEDKFRYCKPSSAYKHIASFAWKRIYTTNIDDAFDVALKLHSPQNVNICGMRSRYRSCSVNFSRLDFVKLHGSVDRLEDGVIFSPEQYAHLSSEPHYWYVTLPQIYTESMFLFIGTTLKEPAFAKVLAHYKAEFGRSSRKQYLLVPSISRHQRNTLADQYNIECIDGTIEDFSAWLQREFPTGNSPENLYRANNPYLSDTIIKKEVKLPAESLSVLNAVIPLGRAFFASIQDISQEAGEKRFYTGMKPTWEDIKSDIPAKLKIFDDFYNFVINNISNSSSSITVLTGPAGSGKTTTLMRTAYALSMESQKPIFWYNEGAELSSLIRELNKLYDEYILFIHRISDYIDPLKILFHENALTKCHIVGVERANIWRKKCEAILLAKVMRISRLAKEDIQHILTKLQKYGRWIRLGTMSEAERINEFIVRADKQLLIALLEATSGKGFEEIIEDDYERLESPAEKLLVNITGLYTLHDKKIRKSQALSALKKAYPSCFPPSLLKGLEGIIYEEHDRLFVRHPVYVEHLYDNAAKGAPVADAVRAVIESFSAYALPYARSLPKGDYAVFKAIINHRFLRHRIGDFAEIESLFQSIGKQLEADGHYWLQYGLVLHAYGKYEDAQDKLDASIQVYDQPYARHAYGRVLLKLAMTTENTIKADKYFIEGKGILKLLDDDPNSRDDFYPIISLGDGDTRYVAKTRGVEEARETARKYANEIERRKKRQPTNKYLTNAWLYLTTYATTGEWHPQGGFLERDWLP